MCNIWIELSFLVADNFQFSILSKNHQIIHPKTFIQKHSFKNIHPKNIPSQKSYARELYAFLFGIHTHRFGDKDFCVDFWHINVNMSDPSFFFSIFFFYVPFLSVSCVRIFFKHWQNKPLTDPLGSFVMNMCCT